MGSSDENFGPARFFDERLAQSKGRWERLPRPESREPLSGGGCRHFAVFRQKTRIPDGVGPPERGNSGKFAVLGQKTGAIFGNPTKISGIFGNPTKISKMRGFSTKSSPNSRAVGSASRARNPGSPFPAGDAAISRFSDKKRGFRTELECLREEILQNTRFSYEKTASF